MSGFQQSQDQVAELERILLKTKQIATEQIQKLERELAAARAVVRTAKNNIPMSCHVMDGKYYEQLQCVNCQHQGKCAIQKLDIALDAYQEVANHGNR